MKDAAMKSTGKDTQMDTGLHTLFIEGLKDLLWAEEHFFKNLTKLQAGATSRELAAGLESRKSDTSAHIEKLKEVFASVNEPVKTVKCDAMEGLVKEAMGCLEDYEEGTMVRDAALIMSAQKIIHYEIASYGTLATFAKVMGHMEAKNILGKVLDADKAADEKLTRIAESFVNESASKEKE